MALGKGSTLGLSFLVWERQRQTDVLDRALGKEKNGKTVQTSGQMPESPVGGGV